MKRIIILLGICFCISGVYAQKFEATPLDEQGDVYEVKIRQFNKLFGKWFTVERVAEPTDGDVAQRSAWRDRVRQNYNPGIERNFKGGSR